MPALAGCGFPLSAGRPRPAQALCVAFPRPGQRAPCSCSRPHAFLLLWEDVSQPLPRWCPGGRSAAVLCNTRLSPEREGASRGADVSAEASPEPLYLTWRSRGGPGQLQTKASPRLSCTQLCAVAVSGNGDGSRVTPAGETDGTRGKAPSRGFDTCQHQRPALAGLRPLSGLRPCGQLTSTVGTHSHRLQQPAAGGLCPPQAIVPTGTPAAAVPHLCAANCFAGQAAATFLPPKTSE